MNPRILRIIKNTAFLYIRLLFVMLVSLYISRKLLVILGVEDYGIYAVVGSITAMFASIKSVFAEATQRYLNNAKGKNDKTLVRNVFNTSMYLHVIVGFVFVLIVLVVGHILLDSTLQIPSGRELAARKAFHFSVLSVFIIILTIPFDAAIIANEKINVYAIVSIIDSFLKLVIVCIVPLFDKDNLVLYTFLICGVSVFTLVVYYIYTRRFEECKFVKIYDKNLIKELGSFSFWNFIGNIIFSMVHEVYNMFLNIYGGVVSNAARNIAYQARSAVSSFTNNALIAVKPFVMQEAAITEKEKIFAYIYRLSYFTFYMAMTVALPIIVFAEEILDIWLVEVPEGATLFTQLVVLALLIRSLHGPLSLMFVSFAEIKLPTIAEGLLFAISIPIVYIMLVSGMPLWSMFAFLCALEFVCILTLTYVAKFSLSFNAELYCRLLIKLSFILVFISSITLLIKECTLCWGNSIVSLAIKLFISVTVILFFIYMFMNKNDKKIIHDSVLSIFKR